MNYCILVINGLTVIISMIAFSSLKGCMMTLSRFVIPDTIIKKIALLLLVLHSVVWSDIHIMTSTSFESGELDVDADLSTFFKSLGKDSYFIGVGAMGFGKEPSTGDAIYSLYSLDLFFQVQLVPFETVRTEVGIKGVFSQINGYDFLAVPVGITSVYTIYNQRIHPILFGSVFYGPARLSGLDAKDYLEYRIGIGLKLDAILEFFEQSLRMELNYFDIFVGYRTIITNYNNIDVVLNEAFYGGVKLAF